MLRKDALDYAPCDEVIVTTNPPSFVWRPIEKAQSYTLEYSKDPNFTPEATTRVTGIDISIYTPPEMLDTSSPWFWRVQALEPEGNSTPFTDTRTFRISEHATILPLPSLDEVRAWIPLEHPRLFITKDNIDDFLGSAKEGHPIWTDILAEAKGLLDEPLPQEPPNCKPGGVWDVKLWREFTITVKATNNMETLAFAYMLTGYEELGQAAVRWMMHIASWDPKGATSAAINDESSLPILYKMSRAYTWAYDALSPEEREHICHVMRIRGNEAYQILKARPFESRPYGSHAGRSLGFLGEAAIAFLGEIPEAKEWFDYIVKIFFAIYPAWGGDPGGWAEGHSYWASYMNRVLYFVDALKVATGLNLYEKAFFKNTGWFKLHTHPPYSKMGPFGDFADRGPNRLDGNVMAHFAAVYHNPYFFWYAKALEADNEGGVMGYIRNILYPRAGLEERSPGELPPSKYFSDVGWVALHKELGQESIQFMLKSSPYGSFSHSLADQNTFTLEAYGAPLAISSGYRPWYGSKHHMGWTKTTQAHNGILVNGLGQRPQSLEAKGQIIGFINGTSFDYTAGDATKAYGELLDKFIRNVVYIRPDIFVIYDDISAPKPSRYSWLLHAYEKMAIEDEGRISLSYKGAGLQAQLWASDRVIYSQTNEFAVPLDEPMDKPIQWHLTCTTEVPNEEGNFLAVLLPTRLADNRRLGIQRLDQGVAIKCNDLNATLLFAGREETLKSKVLEASARIAAEKRDTSSTGFLLINGTWLKSGDFEMKASLPIDAEITLEEKGIVANFNIPWEAEAVTVTIAHPSLKAISLEVGEIPWKLQDKVLYMTFPPGKEIRIKGMF